MHNHFFDQLVNFDIFKIDTIIFTLIKLKRKLVIESELTSLEKSAIILHILGKKSCQKIFLFLRDSEVKKILIEMKKIKKVPHSIANEVLEEFHKVLSEEENLLLGRDTFFFNSTKGKKEHEQLLNFLKNKASIS